MTGTTGNDDLHGTTAADSIEGLAGNDTLDGAAGDDTLRGGDGDDTFSDASGNDSIDGGAGNDVIAIARSNAGLFKPLHENVTLSGGDGDDRVSFDIAWDNFTTASRLLTASLAVDLGAGNDSFYLDDNHAAASIVLGSGRDRIELGEQYLQNFGDRGVQPIVVADFQAGAGGDVLDLGGLLVITGWDRTGNPFASGELRLLQLGADTVIAIDLDGADGDDQLDQVLRLTGVQASSLVAANFRGFDPGRGPVTGLSLTGGGGADSLDGAAGNDSLAGNGGADVATGGFGNDSLDGGDGDDSLEGGYGNDRIAGGPGDDLLEDLHGGSDTLTGGDGNDRIRVQHGAMSGINDAVVIDAGAGNDDAFFSIRTGTLAADMGAGDDRLTLQSYPDGGSTITLGAGQDVLVLDPFMASQVRGLITVTDFQAGNGGDRLDWLEFARSFSTLAQGANPFAAGAAELLQVGADTALRLKQSAATITVVVFKNTTVASFTDFNFGVDIGARPPVPEPVTQTGTAGNDNIADPQGKLTLAAGAGDDRISVFVEGSAPIGSLDAGDGNDTLTITYSGNNAAYVASMGAGDDRVKVAKMAGDIRLTLGSGKDTIELPAGFSTVNASTIVVTDFATGAGGDVLDLTGWLSTGFPSYQTAGRNPFALGYLELRQAGADVELRKHADGGPDSLAIVRFTGTTVAAYTAANFGGWDPQVAPNTVKAVTTDFVVAAGTTDAALDTTPVGNYRPHYTYASQTAKFTNHGTVTTEATTAGAGTLAGFIVTTSWAESQFLNAFDGTFIVRNLWKDVSGDLSFGSTYGFYAQNPTATFTNDGVYQVSAASGMARGVISGFDVFNPHAVTNSGTFSVTAPVEATGVILGSTGSFRNDGSFTVTGGEFAYGVYITQYHAQSIVNTGTMTVHNDPKQSPWASIAILLPEIEAPFAGSYQHWNSGTIEADYAYYIYEVNESLGGFKDVLHNSGTIRGAVALGRGDDLVTNTGAMQGRTFLGDGNDIYEGSRGTHTGSIEGQGGNDTLRGGAGDENLFGDAGADVIFGGAGDDYIDGGSGSDRLDGGAGTADILSYFDSLLPVLIDLQAGTATTAREQDRVSNFEWVSGSRGHDTILGSSADEVLFGFNGNDSLSGRGGDDVLVGERGNDTLAGGAGADRFVFSIGDGHDEITDFAEEDVIDLYGADALGVDPWQSIVQVGADVLVTINATDSVLVRNAVVADVETAIVARLGLPELDVPGFDAQPLRGDADLVIAHGVDFMLGDTRPQVNFDTLPASTALFLNSGVGLWNSGTVAIATTAGDSTTRAVATAPRSLDGTQSLANRAGGVISATAAAGDVVAVDGLLHVWNAGSIVATAAAGDATGIGSVTPEGSGLVNSGSVTVTASGAATGIAQDRSSSDGDATVVNSGSVTVHGGTASLGVDVRFSTPNPSLHPAFVNSGTIAVTDATATLDSVGLRVDLAANAAVWNSGSITADYAIRTTPAVTGSTSSEDAAWGLHVYNTGTLNGLVALSNWTDAVVNTGTMAGGVFLGGGDDLYDGRGGTTSGLVDGYDGDDTLLGGAGSDSLSGSFGNDVLGGGAGADWLSGGAGSDKFRFQAGDGQDVIADFEAAVDVIEVSGYTAWLSIVQAGADVLITFAANDTLLLQGVNVGAIGAQQVHFGSAAIAGSVIPQAPLAASAPQEPAADPLPAATNPLVIMGSMQQGGTLNAALAAPPGGLSGGVFYQWFADLLPVAGGAGTSLSLPQGRVGSVITVTATYTDATGHARSITSDPTQAIANVNDPHTGGVSFQGTAALGSTLTASSTLADPDGLGPLHWQWLLDGSPVNGATQATFVVPQDATGKVVSVQATYTDAFGSTESAASAARSVFDPAQASVLDGVVYHWKSHALLAGVGVAPVASGTQSPPAVTTGQDGRFTFEPLAHASYDVTLTRSTADTGGAITSADALAALRIAVGINPNPDPDGAGPLTAPRLSPYQLIAADADGDGRITSADALAILRMAVKSATAPPAEWLFVSDRLDYWNDANGGSSTLTRNSVAWNPHPLDDLQQDITDNRIAVLRGDVDGSWTPPAGSANLGTTDPAYLQLVGTTLGVPA